MKIIKDASEGILKILGERCTVPEDDVRFATWCIACTTAQSDVLLLNVLTKELILLQEKESEFLCLDTLSKSRISCISGSELYRFLCKHWFLVAKEQNDKELIKEIRAVVSCLNTQDGITGYTILTTTGCNARCFYCYEKGMKEVSMNRQTALDTAEYIKQTAAQKIKLHWFGGEPLYHLSAIDIITTELKEAGINFDSVIISNGYLITDDIIKKARETWNLKRIQITLDGTEQVYNQRKAYVHSIGSAFWRVMSNIEKLLNAGINVVIRLNLDMKNAEDLYHLSDLLAETFGAYENFSVYAFYIFESEAADSLGYSFSETYDKLVKLRNYLTEKGLTHPGGIGDSIKINHCMADSNSSIVISPTGDLYKCEHIGQSRNCGTIYTGVQDQEMIAYWKIPPEDGEICDSCPLYADCIRINACTDEFAFCPQSIYEERINNARNAMLHTYTKAAADRSLLLSE